MNTTQETSVTSSQDRCRTVEVQKNGTKISGETKADNNGTKLTIEELFPWIREFKKKCRFILAQPNIVALIKLMKFYARNVSINVNECYTKPYRAAKLKDSISETLLFFLFYFRELVEVCDKNSYLDKMSDLLAMYLDMELKASRRGKEHHSKIAARLTSCLYVYLEDSYEHILDTFIKAKFINRNYHDILDPVLTKISKTLPAHPNCDTMYVRYLLIYRLWKKVNNDAAIKNQINATAILNLGPPPLNPTPFLAKYVLPKVPKSQANSIKFLLLHKFDIEKSCRLFIQYCKENREDEDQGDLNKSSFVVNVPSSNTLETLGGSSMSRGTSHVDNLTDNANILPEAERCQRSIVKANFNGNSESVPGKCAPQKNNMSKYEPSEISPLTPLRSAKVMPRLKTKTTGDILIIDLTADEVTEKVIKKKKHRKLHWLTEVKRKLSTKSIKAAAEKKKKALTLTNISLDNLMLPGLVDSTSAACLSTAITPQRTPPTTTNPAVDKSLSITTMSEPENCVTSNSMENDWAFQEEAVNSRNYKASVFAGEQPTCDVTTTVTELTPVASDKLEQITSIDNKAIADCKQTISSTDHAINPLPENSCHRSSEQDKVHSQKSATWTTVKLSDALNHICQSYDSDKSTLSSGREEKVDPNQEKALSEVIETNVVEAEIIPVEREEVFDSMELDKESKKARCRVQTISSENSNIDIICTSRASDAEIVNIDDYTNDNRKIHDAKWQVKVPAFCATDTSEKEVHSSTDSTIDEQSKQFGDIDLIQDTEPLDVNDLSKTVEINSNVKHFTQRNNELKLISSSKTLSTQKNTEKERLDYNQTENFTEGKNLSGKERNSNDASALKLINPEKTQKAQFFSPDENDQIVKPSKNSKTLLEVKQREQFRTNKPEIHQQTLGKVKPMKVIYYNTKRHCDYESNKVEQLNNIKLTPPDNSVVAKNHGVVCVDNQAGTEIIKKKTLSIRKEYVEEQTLIPKINEIVICTKNDKDNIRHSSRDLLRNQEPEFIENIDGLSLLASVSQHVSHLEEYSEKLLSKPKTINGKEINDVIEEIGTEDSYNLLLDFNADTSTETINEIVGVPLHVDDNKVNEVDLSIKNCEKNCCPVVEETDSLDAVPLILETTVDLNSSTLHNNLISVENVTQIIKESTNVIVNGETVVLLQKSPNSNLYIINEAVNGTIEYASDGKRNVTKNTERNSATNRDIINHIPINLSDKNTEHQKEGKETHHLKKTTGSNNNKTDGKKLDSSEKMYETQLLSKQFKPICDKFSQQNNNFENEYIKTEIVNMESYEDSFRQRCADTPGSVVELELVKKSPPPVIRLTDTPVDILMLTNQQEMYQELSVMNMTTPGRINGNLQDRKSRGKAEGTSTENLTYKQNIKQEFQSCVDNDLFNETESDSQQALRHNYTNINPNDLFSVNSINSTKIPHVYSAVTTATSLYNLEHERCSYPSCNLKVNTSQSYEPIPQSVPNCQLPHCACLNCAYEVHCRQYIQRPAAAVAHSSYLQKTPYFLANNSSIKPCTIQERESKVNEAVLAKLHDDQLLHNIEQSIIDSKQLHQTTVKTISEIKYKPEFDSKLPLKKRLKAHAMLSMSFEGAPVKIEKVENYPGTPMMSIAALETRNDPQNTTLLYEDKTLLPSTALELSPRVKDDSFSHHTTEMIRRDYLKDTSLTSIGNCSSVDDRFRKIEQQRRQTNSHVNIMGTGCQRSFKTPAQRKEITISSPLSLKRAATQVINHPKTPKKVKKIKAMANGRQTRSSKRNIPKVDYSYDGIIDADPKFNTLSELRRKQKKTSR